MQLTKIDRMERIEHMIQSKIEQTEKDIASLKSMPDPEICSMRMMYEMNMHDLMRNLRCIRTKLDAEYRISQAGLGTEEERMEIRQMVLDRNAMKAIQDAEKRKEEEYGEKHKTDIKAGSDDKGHRVGTGDEADHERGTQKPGCCGLCGERVHHVGRDGGDIPGNPAGHGARRRVRRWQIEAMIQATEY